MNILDKIVEVKKEEVKKLRNKFSRIDFESMEFFNSPCLSFIERLRTSGEISIIAEIKKASPSKGIIKNNFNHLKIAEDYFKAGANAVSVLTDEKFFMGSINYLKEIAVNKSAPLLRKDFIIDEFQVLEAKTNGADLILLICEILEHSQIKELSAAASEIGLEVLLELHNKNEIAKIDFSLNKLIGINNRNLESFNVDLSSTAELRKYLPDDVFIVSESGIHSREDILYLKQNKVNAILVGEHLMKSDNIQESLFELKRWCTNED